MSKIIYIDIETLGLNALYDRITCIGVIVDDDESGIEVKAFLDENEELLLKEFVEYYNKIITWSKTDPYTVTWNGETFDLPYIKVRGWLYGLYFEAINSIDARKLFPSFVFYNTTRAPSLSEAAKFLGLSISKIATGEEAVYMFKYKKYDELKAYCVRDVEVLREIYLKIANLNNRQGK